MSKLIKMSAYKKRLFDRFEEEMFKDEEETAIEFICGLPKGNIINVLTYIMKNLVTTKEIENHLKKEGKILTWR